MKNISLTFVLFLTATLLCGTWSKSSARPFVNNDSLIAFYPFNGNANDESGNNHNGSVVGASLTTDRFNQSGNAYNFVYNGFSSDRIEVSGTSDFNFATGGFSISAWVKFSGLATGGYNYPIFSKHICGQESGYILMLYNGKLTFWLAGSGGYNVLSTTDDYTNNSWHQVVAVYDGATQHIYVDGVLKNSTPFSYTSINSANWALGGYNGCNGGFNGKVDEIKVFNQALTGAEIQDMYKKSANDLIVYLPFNGDAIDESGNGNDGTINGNATLTTDRYVTENKAFTFPDQSSSISLANSTNLNLENGFAINAWVKYKSNNITAAIVCKHVCGFPNGFFFGIDTDGQIQLWLANSAWSTVRTNTTFVENKWYMMTASYDAGTGIAKVYINGEMSGSGNVTYSNFSSNPISIGESYNNNCSPGNLSGAIDEVKIFNRPLSDAEISEEYTTSRNSLVAYYPFEGNANDESGNGNDGTITGAMVTPTADRYGAEGEAYKFWFPDYVSVPTNSSFFTDEFTVSYWYKVEAYWGDRGVLSCVGNKGGYQQVFSAGTTFTYLLGYNFPNSSWFWTNYIVPNTPNTWQHITTTYKKTGDNASDSKLYINGELKSSDNYGNSIAYPGSEIFYIGRNHSDLGLNGELDEVRLYSKALNDQEIKGLFLTETKPILLNPANQTSVTTLTPEMFWSSPLANSEFRFQLSTDSLFGTILHELLTTDRKTQLPDALLTEGQSYYWRVQAKLNGETGPWSSVWSFNFVNTGIDKPNRDVFSVRISPNPANASAKITYLLPGTGTIGVPVTIEILNSIGTSIKKLDAKKVQRGTNEIEIETGSLQPGIYYCRLKAGNISIVRKLVIMH